jgi:hypothetical protein
MSEVQILSPRPNLACARIDPSSNPPPSTKPRLLAWETNVANVGKAGILNQDLREPLLTHFESIRQIAKQYSPAKLDGMIRADAGAVQHEPGELKDLIPARIQPSVSRS